MIKFWNKNKKEAQETLKELSDSFSAVKARVEITPKVQSEYIAYHNKVDTNAYSEEYMLVESEKLWDDHIVENDKKRILFILGHIGTLSCVKVIEEFIQKSKDELKQWAILSFEEGWMFLENEAMGTNKGRIFSGAGGDGNKLHYYFSVRAKNKKSFSEE